MRYCYLIIIILIFSACGKELDVGSPTDRTVANAVYASDATAAGVLTGLYYNMSKDGAFSGSNGLGFICGLSADEYTLSEDFVQWKDIWQNALTPTNVLFWGDLYQYIYVANAAIEGLTASKTLTPAVQQQLLGEAYFIRALAYSYLMNLFGDVPLLTSTDAQLNKKQPRTDSDQVYELIVADLINATNYLDPRYLKADLHSTTPYRVRPAKWAAMALLSRVYLYKGDWNAAKAQADSVIAHVELFNLERVDQVFLRESKEAIWQLEPVNVNYTQDGYLFNVEQPVCVSPSLVAAFEEGDFRKISWLKPGTVNGMSVLLPYKYKQFDDTQVITECLTVLRLGELYLNRAEALAQRNDLSAAKADLDEVRSRAGLAPVEADSKAVLLSKIYHERQVELFSEMGHRWFDLKRSGLVDDVMSAATVVKGGVWATYQQWYPIPFGELQLNSALTQNSGY